MKTITREITKEVYDRAKENHDLISGYDVCEVFTEAEQIGYGIYNDRVYEKDGHYYVTIERGENCD